MSQARNAEFTHRMAWVSRDWVGKQVAAAQGLTGAAASVFLAGFNGVDIRKVNPRAEGLEAEYRAGRAAWAKPDMQQRCRAEAVKIAAECPHAGLVINLEQN